MRTIEETNSCSLYTVRAAQAGEIGECLNCFCKVKSWLGRVKSARPEGGDRVNPAVGRACQRDPSHTWRPSLATYTSLDEGSLETAGRQSFFNRHTQDRDQQAIRVPAEWALAATTLQVGARQTF